MFDIYYGIFKYAKERFDNDFSKYDKADNVTRTGQLLKLDLEKTKNSTIKIDKNIVDEYFEN